MPGLPLEGAAAAAVLVLAGFVASVLNVVAGGGSFIVLPILLFLGLPAADANGTNRVGIFLQNVGAVWDFERSRVLDRRLAVLASIPATLGAGAGAWLALLVDDRSFRRVLSAVMVAITLWTLLDRRAEGRREGKPASPGVLALGFLAVGFYAGFIQAGVGFLILAVTTMAGLDLVRGNALKVTVVLILTVLTLAIFVWHGHVRWVPGLALAAGSLAGGVAGARLTVLRGQGFVKAVLVATIAVFAVLLWFEG
ncbi:MAG TPA: sulfite exporter TauE/SafE family protein [Vicinamibacteria bacterium]|nr:sulfite exporter TauE/SafE family protein [Vicinamibacteria bacterium]